MIVHDACAECHRPFAGKRYQRYCSRACWLAVASRERRGIAPVAALVARAAEAKRTARAELRIQFGNLRARDRAIFKAAYELGYRRGYGRGRSGAHAAIPYLSAGVAP